MTKKLGFIVGIALGVVLFASGAVYYINRTVTPQGPSDNWTQVSKSEDGDQTYIDTNSIRYSDNRYVKVWVMISRLKPTESGTVTSIALTYIDCVDDQFQLGEGHTTDGPYGHGKHTGDIAEGPVKHITPDSVASDVEYAVCKPLYDNAVQQDNKPDSDNKPTVLEHKNI